ncbi:XRE family transcriptional regulator [Paraburkholderia sp. 40]|uniref:XRE family transcriptional regulator n=1 Tax=unclassified Paraburkholderia TaxID=2615204 RepID=UPI003D2075FA
MNRHTQSIGHLERSAENDRRLAARLDGVLKQAGISSTRAAKWLGVREYDVQYWRSGIAVPPLNACMRLGAIFHLDVHWLCTGQPQVA